MASKRHPTPAPDRLLTTREACERYGLKRTAFWERGRRDPSFPQPLYIGDRSPRWSQQAIDAYIARKTAERPPRGRRPATADTAAPAMKEAA